MTGKVVAVLLDGSNRVTVNIQWDGGNFTLGFPVLTGQSVPSVGQRVAYYDSSDEAAIQIVVTLVSAEDD